MDKSYVRCFKVKASGASATRTPPELAAVRLADAASCSVERIHIPLPLNGKTAAKKLEISQFFKNIMKRLKNSKTNENYEKFKNKEIMNKYEKTNINKTGI